MKNSDSKNSLDNLNEQCIICIDDNDNSDLFDSKQFLKCNCNFKIHRECWYLWNRTKPEFQCPNCGENSMKLTIVIPKLDDELQPNRSKKQGLNKKTIGLISCVGISTIAFVIYLSLSLH